MSIKAGKISPGLTAPSEPDQYDGVTPSGGKRIPVT